MNASGEINNVSFFSQLNQDFTAKLHIMCYKIAIEILQSLLQPIKIIQEPHTIYSCFAYIKYKYSDVYQKHVHKNTNA